MLMTGLKAVDRVWGGRGAAAAGVPHSTPFWLEDLAALQTKLETSPDGLASAQAEERLTRCGRNAPVGTRRAHLAMRIVKRLTEPLVAILVVAAILSGAVGDPVSSIIIIVVIALSITLDLAQEHKAERTADSLRRSVAIMVDVLRDRVLQQVPSEEIVPGDVVLLKSGDLVPADGIVLASSNAHANETVLTGEAYPSPKKPGPSHAASPSDAYDALFAGTSLTSGEARMLVVTTGGATMLGSIARELSDDRPPTAFERGINRLGYMILRLTVFLSLFVLLMHLANHRPVLESFLFALALAVGLTPELLPMVTTVTLSRGALRMAEKKVVVKRLSSIHDLGALDILCTDKTGTLTEARIVLVGHPDKTGVDSDRVLRLAAVNSHFESGVRSPLDDAILARTPGQACEGWRKIAELPFDFERRRVSVLVEHGGQAILAVKGAAEEILRLCSRGDRGDAASEPLGEAERARLQAMHDDFAAKGQRLLGVAYRPMPESTTTLQATDEQDLVFAGFCVFLDPPKASAVNALAQLAAAGVRVKIISGDSPLVAQHLVQTLKLNLKGSINGDAIADLNDHALAATVEEVDIFCRVSPDQKTRIVRALKARGHTVGFLGDGINDAPAIRTADVGISVDGATEVAREAADMILLQSDLCVLAQGIEEGRRTFVNIQKYVRMVTSSNLGNMLSMALASLWLPFLPLTPVQILINNFLYDTSEIGIPFDNVDSEDLAAPRTWNMSGILRFMLIMGPVSSLFDLVTFLTLQEVFSVSHAEFRSAWFLESMATQILVIFVIRTSRPAWLARPHPLLVATSLGALAVAFFLALGPLGHFVGFAMLSPSVVLAVLVIVAAYLLVADLAKPFAMKAAR